jgi:crossover junction endodeoxyribonuclease RusA
MTQEVTLPWPLKNLSPNARPHYMVLAAAKKKYRYECGMLAKQAKLTDPGPGKIKIEIEFFPPDRHERDTDNLLASMKSGLDGIADAMKVNDNRFWFKNPVVSETIGGMVKVRISKW